MYDNLVIRGTQIFVTTR